jgi:uncharacterized protein
LTRAARAFVPFAFAHLVVLLAAAAGWLEAAGLSGAALAFAASAFGLRLGLGMAALALLSRAPRADRVVGLLPPLLFTGVLVVLFVDRRLWDLQRVHFGRAHLSQVLRPNAVGWMHLEPDQVAWFAAACAGLLALECGAWWALLRRESRHDIAPPLAGTRAWRMLLVVSLVLAAPGALWRPFASDRLLLAARVVPLPPSRRAPEKSFVLDARGRAAGAPAPAFVSDSVTRRDIVIVVIDSWRSDELTPDVTPNLFAFSGRSAVFRNHWSASNATDWSMFSILHGLLPPYYVTQAREAGPPLFRRARELGYRAGVFWGTSANLGEDAELKDLDPSDVHIQRTTGDIVAQDRWTVDRFEEFARSVPPETPLLAVVFLAAPHAPYWFDAADAPFEPYEKTLRYASLQFDDPATIPLVRNRYRNALRFSDGEVGRMLAVLKERGRLDDAVVAVTGDHGEMFKEHGAWGHGRGFSAEELHVPLVLHGLPGLERGSVIDRSTSHLDLSPTLLRLLGAEGEPASFSNGRDLLELAPRPERMACTDSSCAVIREAGGGLIADLSGGTAAVLERDGSGRAAPLSTEDRSSLDRLQLELSRFME